LNDVPKGTDLLKSASHEIWFFMTECNLNLEGCFQGKHVTESRKLIYVQSVVCELC